MTVITEALTAAPAGAPVAGASMTGGAGRTALLALCVALLCAVLGVAGAASASAHPLSTTAILLEVDGTHVTGRVQLPIDRLAIGLDELLTPESVVVPAELARLRSYVGQHTAVSDSSGATWRVEVSGGHVERIDAVDHLVFDLIFTPPQGRVRDFTLTYDAIVHHLLSHQVLVSVRAAGTRDYTTAGVIDWQEHSITVHTSSAATSDQDGFFASVHLGVEHIAGGADHLLFLVMLLLPAPLLARNSRWVRRDDLRQASWRVVHVVTAFAIGHSITLALAALGYLHVNSRVVESLIAVSILASAVHAIKPLVPGGEAAIAAGFGLVHGLAFAALIDTLGLGRGSLVTDLLGFNLGIEVTQLLVVALLMPSLLLLSRTRVYPAVRIAIAAVGAVLAAAWLAQRTTLIATDPLDGASDVLIDHPFLVAGLLAVAAAASWAIPRLRVTTAAARPRTEP